MSSGSGVHGRSPDRMIAVDADFGPFFIKFCTYFPFTAKLCINGNEWAKRQAARADVGFEPLDNGFAACADVPALQAICDSLTEDKIEARGLSCLGAAGQPPGRARPPVRLLPARVRPAGPTNES